MSSEPPAPPQPRLRPLHPGDCDALIAVYRDAVLQLGAGRYSSAQLQAWADHAASGGAIAQALHRGHGLASLESDGTIAAFGVLEPLERLSLLYCRSRSCRRGHGSAILAALEQHASTLGVMQLRTEASQLSRPLLLRRGWQVEAEETVRFAGVWFTRWRMIKRLPPLPPLESHG